MAEIHLPGYELDGGPNPDNPEEYCENCLYYYFKGFEWMVPGKDSFAITTTPPDNIDFWSKAYCRYNPEFKPAYKNNWCGRWEKKTT